MTESQPLASRWFTPTEFAILREIIFFDFSTPGFPVCSGGLDLWQFKSLQQHAELSLGPPLFSQIFNFILSLSPLLLKSFISSSWREKESLKLKLKRSFKIKTWKIKSFCCSIFKIENINPASGVDCGPKIPSPDLLADCVHCKLYYFLWENGITFETRLSQLSPE